MIHQLTKLQYVLLYLSLNSPFLNKQWDNHILSNDKLVKYCITVEPNVLFTKRYLSWKIKQLLKTVWAWTNDIFGYLVWWKWAFLFHLRNRSPEFTVAWPIIWHPICHTGLVSDPVPIPGFNFTHWIWRSHCPSRYRYCPYRDESYRALTFIMTQCWL